MWTGWFFEYIRDPSQIFSNSTENYFIFIVHKWVCALFRLYFMSYTNTVTKGDNWNVDPAPIITTVLILQITLAGIGQLWEWRKTVCYISSIHVNSSASTDRDPALRTCRCFRRHSRAHRIKGLCIFQFSGTFLTALFNASKWSDVRLRFIHLRQQSS